jgi:methylmalonyl-CoA/ethylmalonyl-CoA epimerase
VEEKESLLGIKRVDHVAMAVWKVEEHLSFLTEVLGMKVAGRFRSEEERYTGVVLDILPGEESARGVQWEVLEPTSEDSFLARFLRERGPGLHHVTLEVEDVDAAARVLREKGIEPYRGVRESGGWKETFIHPQDSGGVLIQLYQEIGGDQDEHE